MSTKAEQLAPYGANIRESMGAFRESATIKVADVPAADVGRQRRRDVWTIELDRIIPDQDQPRTEFDEDSIQRLAESLRARGQLQPVQVRWDESAGKYVLILGERRWRAAHVAGLTSLACVVRDAPMTEADKLAVQLIENCLREDLTPMDQARSFRKLMDDAGWDQARLASELAVAKSTVTRALALLKLPTEVQADVERGELPRATAYEITKASDPKVQTEIAREAVEQRLTRDQVSKRVREETPRRKPAKRERPPVTRRAFAINGYTIEISNDAGLDPDMAARALVEAAGRFNGIEVACMD